MSLRSKVVLAVLGINLLIFGILAVLVPQDIRQQRDREIQGWRPLFELFQTLADTIAKSGERTPNFAAILAWPHWDYFEDALLMEGRVAKAPAFSDDPFTVIPSADPIPVGLFFNPGGRFRRNEGFNLELAKRQIAEAIDRNAVIPGPGTVAVPITLEGPGGRKSWGGGFFVLRPAQLPLLSLRTVLLLMGASMLLLGLVTYLVVSRLVLEPVVTLAAASRRVAEGDLAVHLDAPRSSDEIAELMRRFDEMIGKLRNHRSELRSEVEIATEKASRAERDLLTAQRLAALGTLAAGIAHEINNPLGGMLNAARALEKKDLSAEKRAEYLDIVLHGLERIRLTVSRVLQFTPRNPEVTQVSLAKAIAAAGALAAHRFVKQEIEIETRVEPGELAIRGNAGELEQLFLNLFLNSADAIGEKRGGRILVSARAAPEGIEIVVEDNGCGMKEELLARALDPFFSTKEVGKGSGLGLSIVFSIVRGMGGKLQLWSRPGEGFRVRMLFPGKSPQG